ncbi:MAG: redoxin domain-containing protein [Bacillota bacterium]|nr:redoxin domain-containing protein [Bacillota bacterium]
MSLTLKEQLAAMMKKSEEKLPREIESVFKRAIEDMANSGSKYGLKAGDRAPDFKLKNQTGSEINLTSLLKKGPVILTFFRGAWCPYCNLQLTAYQDILPLIESAGASILAISPQSSDDSLSYSEKKNLGFDILGDTEFEVARLYNVLYELPDYLQDVYKTIGINLQDSNADKSWRLPLTATYIIDKMGMVCYAFVDVDYKKRMEPQNIISILELIK